MGVLDDDNDDDDDEDSKRDDWRTDHSSQAENQYSMDENSANFNAN